MMEGSDVDDGSNGFSASQAEFNGMFCCKIVPLGRFEKSFLLECQTNVLVHFLFMSIELYSKG